jgi:thiamine pyrophosphokinase
MEKRALLITGGRGPIDLHMVQQLPNYSYVCAADSGLDTAQALGISVDEAIGDFDSLVDAASLDYIAHIRLPRNKDATDTEAMLKHIQDRGFDSYVLIGGGEGRFDHLFHLYSLFSVYGAPEQWITAQERLYLVRDTLSFTITPSSPISLLPAYITGSSQVSSQNLFWELEDFLISWKQQSISNTCRESHGEITVCGDPIFVSIPFPNKN